MTSTKTSPSVMNKYNTLAVIVVCIAFIYVWKIESTPTPPLDRTVNPKSSTGTTTTPVVSPLPPVETPPKVTPPTTDTGSTSPVTQSGSTSSNLEDDDTSDNTMPPPPSSTESPGVLDTPTSLPTATGATQSGLTTYYNAYLDYGLSLPKGAYYAGYGGQDGAAHTMGFASGTGVTSFEDAPIKLWYYPNKLLAELGNGENSFYQDPGTNMTYLKLGNGTIKLEGNMEDPTLLKIIETVHRGD